MQYVSLLLLFFVCSVHGELGSEYKTLCEDSDALFGTIHQVAVGGRGQFVVLVTDAGVYQYMNDWVYAGPDSNEVRMVCYWEKVLPESAKVTRISIAAEGNILIAGTALGKIHLFHLETADPPTEIQQNNPVLDTPMAGATGLNWNGEATATGRITDVSISSNGRIFAVAHDWVVLVYTARLIASATASEQELNFLSQAEIFGPLIQEMTGESGVRTYVHSINIGPAGRDLVVYTSDKQVRRYLLQYNVGNAKGYRVQGCTTDEYIEGKDFITKSTAGCTTADECIGRCLDWSLVGESVYHCTAVQGKEGEIIWLNGACSSGASPGIKTDGSWFYPLEITGPPFIKGGSDVYANCITSRGSGCNHCNYPHEPKMQHVPFVTFGGYKNSSDGAGSQGFLAAFMLPTENQFVVAKVRPPYWGTGPCQFLRKTFENAPAALSGAIRTNKMVSFKEVRDGEYELSVWSFGDKPSISKYDTDIGELYKEYQLLDSEVVGTISGPTGSLPPLTVSDPDLSSWNTAGKQCSLQTDQNEGSVCDNTTEICASYPGATPLLHFCFSRRELKLGERCVFQDRKWDLSEYCEEGTKCMETRSGAYCLDLDYEHHRLSVAVSSGAEVIVASASKGDQHKLVLMATPHYSKNRVVTDVKPPPCTMDSSSRRIDTYHCRDGVMCSGAACCDHHFGIMRCPAEKPLLCRATTCGKGNSHCCSTDCEGFGGRMPCSADSAVAIGMRYDLPLSPQCGSGFVPVQDRKSCEDAAYKAELVFKDVPEGSTGPTCFTKTEVSGENVVYYNPKGDLAPLTGGARGIVCQVLDYLVLDGSQNVCNRLGYNEVPNWEKCEKAQKQFQASPYPAVNGASWAGVVTRSETATGPLACFLRLNEDETRSIAYNPRGLVSPVKKATNILKVCSTQRQYSPPRTYAPELNPDIKEEAKEQVYYPGSVVYTLLFGSIVAGACAFGAFWWWSNRARRARRALIEQPLEVELISKHATMYEELLDKLLIDVSLEDTVDTCSVCLEDLIEEKCVCLPCGHRLHHQCLLDYVLHKIQKERTKHPRCPICRSKIDSGVKEEDEEGQGIFVSIEPDAASIELEERVPEEERSEELLLDDGVAE